ncbi:MAG: MBL fold metallo-hydrolase [Gemmatimonadota bacterium]|nr:MBL fold metallo-hydrolase [Gemmatimonadota bacterium]
MRVRFWGTRGSLPASGPETVGYGGNTSCVEVRGDDGTLLVLDAGTGMRRLTSSLEDPPSRIDVLLSHLHLDHIQGLGFFEPLYREEAEVHVWGPASSRGSLASRLSRYLSPPLFPIHLRSLPCRLSLHDVPVEELEIGRFRVTADYVCHPGATVGYRIEEGAVSLAYLPDHEPALGAREFPTDPEWTSGHALAEGVDLLLHDAQYDEEEYARRVGWGHSTLSQAIAFAELCGVGALALFHHDPLHDDATLDAMVEEVIAATDPPFRVVAAREAVELDPARVASG